MIRCLIIALLLGLPARADDILTVNIGGTDIKLSCPPGMIDVPKDNPLYKGVADLTPDNFILLRNCVSSEALDRTIAPDPAANIMTSRTFALKEVTMNIDSGNFIDFVEQQANDIARHGVLLSKDSYFDFVETQKRLDDFQKDTGVGEQDDSDVYSLGMVSRSDACIAFMTAQYVNFTDQGKTERKKCIDIYAYVRLKEKIVVLLTSLIKPTVEHDDIRTLKHEAEKYQLDLQALNNQ